MVGWATEPAGPPLRYAQKLSVSKKLSIFVGSRNTGYLYQHGERIAQVLHCCVDGKNCDSVAV